MWEMASIVTVLPLALCDLRVGSVWANGSPNNLQHSKCEELS